MGGLQIQVIIRWQLYNLRIKISLAQKLILCFLW